MKYSEDEIFRCGKLFGYYQQGKNEKEFCTEDLIFMNKVLKELYGKGVPSVELEIKKRRLELV